MDIRELEDFRLSDAVKFHDALNPDLWENYKLKPEVKDQLLKIANDFILELGVAIPKIKDITISGSNAAYSYTPYSDLDLHILIDFNELSDDEIYQELFTAKKNLYNEEHDIEVYGVPVELYVQDSNQKHISLGEYSIVNDDWIRIPKKQKANFDQEATKAKFEKLGSMIELALKSNSLEKVEKVLDVLKRYRQAGLSNKGEFGPENLSYKALRNLGYIQKLYDYKNQLHSKDLSLTVKEVLDTQPGKSNKAKWDFSDSDMQELNFTASNGQQYRLDFLAPYIGPDEINQYNLLPDASDKYLDNGFFVQFEQVNKRNPFKQGKQGIEGTGAAAEIFGIVSNAILQFVKKKKPTYLYFQAAESNRISLYSAMVKRLLPYLPSWKSQGPSSDGVFTLYSPFKKVTKEASGYIPSEKEKNDPRFKTALTVDVKPDSIQKNARAFGWKISRTGRPPLLRK